MRVLMLAPGNSIHSRRPLQWLLRAGCHVTFADVHDPALGDARPYEFFRFPPDCRFGRRTEARLRKAAVRACAILRLWWAAFRARPQVTHVHWLDYRAYYCALARLKPLVLTAWGSDINLLLVPGVDARVKKLVGRALAKADLVLVDSADMPGKCAQLAGREVPVELFPVGIDTRHFRPLGPEITREWKARLMIPEGAVVFVSLRAMAPLYGHHLILEAFAKASRRMHKPAVLVFKLYNQANYGDAAEYLTGLRNRAAELNVGDLVRWVDEVPHARLPEVYAVADAVINYPLMDGFPVTFIEAAACMCPVITVRLQAYSGTFAETFFRLVPPDDPRGLAEALIEFADRDPAAARSQLAPARATVEREYDESVIASRLLNRYAQLATRQRRGVTGWPTGDRPPVGEA